MPKLYFTRAGAHRTLRRKRELQEKLKCTQGQKGEAAANGGNQWHDNFSFEQLMREEQMLNAQIAEINEKLAAMVVVGEPPMDTGHLRIGHIAVLGVDGTKRIYLVGGFEDSDAATDPPTISYLAPLINPFIGKEAGDIQRVSVAGRTRQVTLEDVRLARKENDV